MQAAEAAGGVRPQEAVRAKAGLLCMPAAAPAVPALVRASSRRLLPPPTSTTYIHTYMRRTHGTSMHAPHVHLRPALAAASLHLSAAAPVGMCVCPPACCHAACMFLVRCLYVVPGRCRVATLGLISAGIMVVWAVQESAPARASKTPDLGPFRLVSAGRCGVTGWV